MAWGGWAVMATIRFASNAPTVMSRIASSTAMANAQLLRQQGLMTQGQLAAIRYAEKMKALRAQQLAMVQSFAGTAAVAGIAGMAYAVSDAAKLQTIMIGIRNATGATNDQMERLRQNAFNLGDRTGMSAVDAAKVMAVIARSSGGVFTDANGNFNMRSFQTFAPKIAEFAAIQHTARGMSVDHATETGIKLAHMFSQFSGPGAEKMFDQMTRLSELMPDNLDKALTQFGYFLPNFKTLGISDQNSVAMMALLDRLGYGRGKGGTSIANLVMSALGPLELTEHAQSGKLGLLKSIGILDGAGKNRFFTDNGADLFGFLRQLAEFARTHGRMTTVKDFKGAFGAQGSRIADLAINPEFLKQLQNISKFMDRKDISQNEQFARYQNSLAFQFGRTVANLQSVMTELGWPWLSDLTKFFRNLANNLHGFQSWLHSNRDAEKTIGVVAASITTIFGAFALAVPLLGALRLAGLLEWLPAIGRAFAFLAPWVARLAPLLLRLVPIVGWIALAIAALGVVPNLPNIVGAITTWWERYQGVVGYTIGYVFGTIGRLLDIAIDGLGATVGAAAQALVQNSWLLLAPNGSGVTEFQRRIADAARNASASYYTTQPGFGAQFGRGITSGALGNSFQPPSPRERLHGTTIQGGVHITINAKDGTDAGNKVLDILRNPQHVLNAAGSFRTSPTLPRGTSIGGAVFGT